MRILHTMVRVGDLQRSIDFYTRVLGMQLMRTTDRPEQKYRLAFVGYGDESSGAVLELTYNYDVPAYDIGTGFGHVAIEVDDAAAACAAVRAAGGHRDARGGPGEGRHDRHRVRAGPRWLQDRADRAPTRPVSGGRRSRAAACAAAARFTGFRTRGAEHAREVVREHVGVLARARRTAAAGLADRR